MYCEASMQSLLEHMLIDASAEPTDLPLSLLKAITNNFSDDLEIGRGGFAIVYKGLLQNGIVAVKKLSQTLDIHEKGFNQEVGSLMRVKHKNIVRFLGYCADTQGKMWNYEGKVIMADKRQRLLCFEFLPNGSLSEYITDASCGLEWRTRYQIIRGVCEGLHYLHQKNIVHLDLKPGNILLSSNMEPKIADFGLSRCFDENQSRAITTKLVGSFGYLAPEFYGGVITQKLDIYSLGVIIIEILTGQKGYPAIENILKSWSDRFRTSPETGLEQVRVCAEIGVECIDSNPVKRPVTWRILEMLDEMESKYGLTDTDPCSSAETLHQNPIVPPEKRYSPPRTSTPTSATPFSAASLHQYTHGFREENLRREGRSVKVYLAELPGGKLADVVKIDNVNGSVSVDDFLELVTRISEIKHPNILELVGYCAEHGQRLLVYNCFSRTTLYEALRDGDDAAIALSWEARLQVALCSGKALEYLHENFQPPIVHQKFGPANVLLKFNNELSVCVSECGLGELRLMESISITNLSGRVQALLKYEAPEFHESGFISDRGDVYSFGVVMLELLTGRKPYDRSRTRHEQHLVRWASSQFHDIESLSKMVDPSIRGQFSEKALSRFADIIIRCIQYEPDFRPPMSEIVQDLTRLVNATGEESE